MSGRKTVQETVRAAFKSHKGNIDDLRLTPQERNILQHHIHNLQNLGTGGIRNPDGSISTVRSVTVPGPNKQWYVLPSVWDGKIISEDQAWDMANRTGWQNWPAYPTMEAADRRYSDMHGYMERDVMNLLAGRGHH